MFHANCLLADDKHEISNLNFHEMKYETIQNVSSAADSIGSNSLHAG